MSGNHILKNLYALIRNAACSYLNEFVWQDIELTEEFKTAYKSYLVKNGCDIEFLGSTAVITSSSTKYIYVPNQWFVIASYSVVVYEELQRYKEFFRKVSERLGKQPDVYAKLLRDYASPQDKKEFIDSAQSVFSSISTDEKVICESAERLWRFVSDYAWWSGQKTIDRGDFYFSVILNMLNLVNASQGYVAEIVCAYASDSTLRQLVTSIDSFTVNMECYESKEEDSDELVDEKIEDEAFDKGTMETQDIIPKPKRVRIKINGNNTLKEFKYKG